MALAALALMILTGCRADVTVALQAGAGGAGEMAVTVRLDEAAALQVGDLAGQLQLADLRAAGWRVAGPRRGRDQQTVVRVSKAFSSPAEAAVVVRELSGDDGPFSSLRLVRDAGFVRTRLALSGEVDLRRGVDAFTDPDLRRRLGPHLGVDLAAAERDLGTALADAVRVRLVARLAGDVEANRPGATWDLRLGERAGVAASSQTLNTANIALAGLGALAGAAGVVLAVVVARRRARRT